jgi:hypothetical protein
MSTFNVILANAYGTKLSKKIKANTYEKIIQLLTEENRETAAQLLDEKTNKLLIDEREKTAAQSSDKNLLQLLLDEYLSDIGEEVIQLVPDDDKQTIQLLEKYKKKFQLLSNKDKKNISLTQCLTQVKDEDEDEDEETYQKMSDTKKKLLLSRLISDSNIRNKIKTEIEEENSLCPLLNSEQYLSLPLNEALEYIIKRSSLVSKVHNCKNITFFKRKFDEV